VILCAVGSRPCVERKQRPQDDQQPGGEHRDDDDRCAAEEHVGDQHHYADQGDGEHGQSRDHAAITEADDALLVVIAEVQPVVRRGGDQQRDRDQRRGQGDEIGIALKVRGLAEALLEGHREQEREQDLGPGKRDPELVEQLDQLAVGPRLRSFLSHGRAT